MVEVSRAASWVWERLATAPAIYGLIVFEVLVAAGSDDDEPETPLLLLVGSFVAFLAFYIAHVFAEVVARHGNSDLSTAIRHGFGHSAGMLYSVVLPALALIICAIVGTTGEDASYYSLAVGMLVLGVLGYMATAQRRKAVGARIIGAILTALIGLIVIFIEYAVH